jgi:hypothetical protein
MELIETLSPPGSETLFETEASVFYLSIMRDNMFLRIKEFAM